MNEPNCIICGEQLQLIICSWIGRQPPMDLECRPCDINYGRDDLFEARFGKEGPDQIKTSVRNLSKEIEMLRGALGQVSYITETIFQYGRANKEGG